MFFVVKVNQFNGSAARPATTDKNGLAPVVLTSYNGTLPANARVISGTVAQRAGMFEGFNYAVKLVLTGVDPNYGEQYRYDVVGEVSTLEVVTKLKEFGQGIVQRESEGIPANTEPKVTSAEKVAP